MVKKKVSEVKLAEIDRLVDRWRESLIGRPKKDGKLNVFLLDAVAAMRAEGFSYAKMAKRLRDVSRRTLLAWAAAGRSGDGSDLEYQFFRIMEGKPAPTETEDKADPFAALYAAKRNREQVATQTTLVRLPDGSRAPMSEIGDQWIFYDGQDLRNDFDGILDPADKIESWQRDAEVEQAINDYWEDQTDK